MSIYESISKIETPDATFEILQLKSLAGSNDVRAAERLFYVQSAGMRLKLVRVTLNNGALRNEPGTLYFMKGGLEMKATTGGGLFKAFKRATFSGESALVNEIHGTGEVYLEPSYGHFILKKLINSEIIVDRSMFYAGSSGLDISASMVSISSAIMGGEGLFQTRISGTGVAALFSKVPLNEIQKIDLDNETLSVDGAFALMRTSGVDFTMRKSSRSWVATGVSGEGFLQTFSGTGSVWIAPTEQVYDALSTEAGLDYLAQPPGVRRDKTKKNKS